MTEAEVNNLRRRVERYAKLQLVRRGVYFGLVMMALVAYRFFPVWTIVCGIVIASGLFWYLEAYCQIHEVKSYRAYMTGYCELYKKPPPKSLPKERGYIKTLFSSWDISPFYISVLLMALLCAVSYSSSLVPLASQGDVKVTEHRLCRLNAMNKYGHMLPSHICMWVACSCSNVVTHIRAKFGLDSGTGNPNAR